MTENVSLKDSELMLKIAGYDSRALEQLYDRYAPILYTLINKIVADISTAEEILSDVFVMIWKHIDQFDFKTNNAYAWLIMLARNKALDVLGRRNGKIMIEYTDEYEIERIIPIIAII